MKPVLKFNDGKILPEEKVRTKKRALQDIINKVIACIEPYGDEVTLYVIEGDKPEDAQWVHEYLDEHYPQYQIHHSKLGPVIAAHLGSGGFGLGYMNKRIRTT